MGVSFVVVVVVVVTVFVGSCWIVGGRSSMGNHWDMQKLLPKYPPKNMNVDVEIERKYNGRCVWGEGVQQKKVVCGL